jgi:capsular polysaccharide biosynthesis protein
MRPPDQSKAVAFSQRLFEHLLAAYPKPHREEYGPAMAQLFRDQSRDAWHEARWQGLAALWLRVLPDLAKTSVLEHLAALKERKSMLHRIALLLGSRATPRSRFVAVSVIVFLLVSATSALITFNLPESYSSTARVKVEPSVANVAGTSGAQTQFAMNYNPYLIQTEFEVIQSEAVLGKAVQKLGLDRAWGKKYLAESGRLTIPETVGLLKARLDLRPVRNTSFVEIRAYSESAGEAAEIANAIAEACQRHHHDLAIAAVQARQLDRRNDLQPGAAVAGAAQVEIMDSAVPGIRPVWPNKPLNLVLGAFGGMWLALVAGAVAAWIASVAARNLPRIATASPSGGIAGSAGLEVPGEMRGPSLVERLIAVMWIALGAILSGTLLIPLLHLLIQHQGIRRPMVARDAEECLALLLGCLFFTGISLTGWFLFRGKSWARVCIGVAAILLAILPRLTTWFSFGLHNVFVAFGLMTICALLWPRKKPAA